MKRFFENTLISGAYSKALRVVALLCVLLGVSTSAWGATTSIAGDFNSWNTDTNKFSNGTCTISLNAGTYQFKIVEDGKWYGNNGTIDNNITNWTFNHDQACNNNCGNCTIKVSSNGNYTFTWNESTNQLSVTFPSGGGSGGDSGGGDTPSSGGHKGTNVGFWDNEACNIKIGNNWNSQSGYGATGNTEIDLGTISGGTSIGFWAQTWKKDGVANVCSPRVYVKLTNGSTTIKNYVYYELSFNSESKDNDSMNQLWLNDNVFTLPTEAGTYQMKVYFEMWGNESGTTGCNNLNYLLNNGSGNYIFNFTLTESGSGGGGDDEEVADCNSNEVQIWCKGENSYIDMYCYAWETGNDSNHPLGEWHGSPRHRTGTYNGETYAVWTVSGYESISVIFNNAGDCQTNDILDLKQGYRYIYNLSNSWCRTTPNAVRSVCGSSEVEEFKNGTLYLNIAGLTDWAKDGALFVARMTKKDGSGTEDIDLVQCTAEPNIYYMDKLVNLANYTKVQMIRLNPADRSQWNQSAVHTFSSTLVCVNVTNWNDASNISTYSGSCTVNQSNVLISKPAEVSVDGQTVSLYGYLSYTYCSNALTEYGFVYCQGDCNPSRNSPRLRASGSTHLIRGEAFELTTDGLIKGQSYSYKAYVMMGDLMMLSDETGYFSLADCTTRPVKGTPITYTIDASLGIGHADDCTLTFGSLETAIKHLKESYKAEDEQYQYVTKNGDSYNLNQDVTMNVRFYDDSPETTGSAYAYKGTTSVASAGSDKFDGGKNIALVIDNINYDQDATFTLTIKADNPNAQPWIHHPIIRNSRNIVMDGLGIYSDPTNKVKDCAFEIDVNSQKWDAIGVGQLANANITIQNCYIGASGFSGIHFSGIDGITLINNDIEAIFDADANDGNAIEWGASCKFMACKNIKFIENNFRGDHCTLLWIQECNNFLLLNNVFWNTNKFMSTTHTPSAIRMVTQFGHDLENIGMFYNTSYFAANTTTSASKYDFMSFKVGSGSTTGSSADFIVSKIYFLYNNCYSYDLDCPGRSDSPFLGISLPDANFCGNNFWSEYDEEQKNTTSAFAFGCSGQEIINVKSQVCATTATGPASLVIQGGELNLGTPLTPEYVKTATNIVVTEDEVTSDRLYKSVRKDITENWTLGAYQQGESKTTKEIIWQGVTSNNWDDRNNWIDAETGNRLTCLNDLAEDLKVIIPSANSAVYPTPSHGVLYWPNIPSSFDAGDRADATATTALPEGIPANEQVTANDTEFAKTIELEYGAGITGVEHLVNGETHYTNAIMGFEAPRSQWILVGTVIKPYDTTLGDYRNIVSGDYFIKNQTPHVYMHEAKLDANGNASWDETFAGLNVEVPATKVFAIQIPDEYGKYKLPAAYYNQWNGTSYDPTEPISYTNFDGRFVNDDELPVYSGLTASTNVLLNNCYPANIDARKIETLTGGTVQYYDYNSGTFMNTDATTDAVLLRPQHGFIFKPASGKISLEITTEMLAGGDTKSRSAEVTLPTLSLNLYNANTGVGYSNVVVKVDNMLAEGEVAPSNVVKVFSPNVESPELYIVANDEMYSRYSVANESQMIPLGVRLKKDMNIKFERAYFQNFSEATLIDTHTDKEINLLRNTYTTETLVAGEIEGRFFLNLGVAVEEEEDNNGDDNVSTELEENEELANGAINIFVDDADNTIKVVTNDVELQVIYVSDMAGRTMKYDVKGYAANLKLPVAQGVYTVSVIGDTASRTEKVILK